MSRPLLAALLLMSLALAGCSGGSDRDTDGDGISDADEERGFEIIVDLLGKRIGYRAYPDPHNADTDGDGLGDAFELQLFPPLDPTKADTDEDGLTDCQEAFHSNRTECESHTWSGQTDGGTGTDPANADSDAGYSRYVTNTLQFKDLTGTTQVPVPWGDGISDGEELAGFDIVIGDGWKRHVVTDPRKGDTDGDRLEDGEERFLYGSDPTVMDTDGDGCDDGVDPIPDRSERYELGLQTLEFLDGRSTADISIHVVFAEHSIWLPNPTGQTTLQGTGPHDLDSLNPAPLAWARCAASPLDPWMRIQVQPYVQTEDGIASLDVTSVNVPTTDQGIVPFVWFNIREGSFAWDHNAGLFDGPLEWTGADARLTWLPQVV